MSTRYRLFLLYLFSFLVISESLGDNARLDSLIELYPTLETEQEQIDMINSIAFQFYTVNIGKTLEYAQEGLERSERINYQEGRGNAINILSIYYEVNGDIDKSLALNKEALEIGEAIQDDWLIAATCTNLGNKYDTKGNPELAIYYYRKAIGIAEKTQDEPSLCLGYANLAMLYDGLSENKSAKLYFEKAQKLLDQHPDLAMYCWFYGILGSWYDKNKNYNEAEICYKMALVEANKRNDQRAIVNLNLWLSKLNLSRGFNKIAEANVTIALETARVVGDKSLTLTTEIGLLELHLNNKEIHKADLLGRNLLSIAQQHDFVSMEMQINRILSEVHLLNDDYKKGYEFGQDYLKLKDTLFSENKRMEVAKIEEKYQSELKEKENKLLRAQQAEQVVLLESQRKLGMALVIIILLISIIGLAIYLAYKNQRNSREKLEEKVTERTKELKESNLMLKKSNDELERFAYIASHDLKEPLRNISGFTKLLQRRLPAEYSSSTNDYFSFIINSTKQMHTLIEDVLEYSRVTQEVVEEPENVNPKSVIKNIVELLLPSLDEKKATIIIEKDLPYEIISRSKIQLLFKNLIENGIKYNQSSIPEIRIGCNKIDSQMVYYVADNGIGVDDVYKEKIFEMFKRLHNRNEYEGSGLGLSVCKKIVEERGGKIWLDTERKNGTTFYFTLEPKPVRPDESKESNAYYSIAALN